MLIHREETDDVWRKKKEGGRERNREMAERETVRTRDAVRSAVSVQNDECSAK